MTSPADWQNTNEAYLVAALTWLRLLLERLAADEPPAPPQTLALPPKKPEKSSFFLIRWLHKRFGEATDDDRQSPVAQTLALNPATSAASADETAKAAAAMAAAEQNEMPPALVILSQRFNLS